MPSPGRSRGSTWTHDRLMHVLGDPQRAYPVIHITGTNGKGSTARMIAELLAAHGLVVGLYTSPHLQRVNERLWWSGEPRQRVDTDGELFEDVITAGKRALPADRDDLVARRRPHRPRRRAGVRQAVRRVRREIVVVTDARPGGPIEDELFAAILSEVAELEPLAGVTPSYFELLHRRRRSPGSRRSRSTSPWSRWDCSVVSTPPTWPTRRSPSSPTSARTTPTSPATGGATSPEEKAGIVKPDSFLVLGDDDAELRPIFADAAGDRLWVRNEDFAADANRLAVGGRLLDIRTPGGVLDELFLPLHGEHQGENAAVAVAAVEAFFARPLDPEVAQIGLGQVRMPGRFEIAGRSPLVIIDGAHNPDGAEALAETVTDDFEVAGKVILVLGFLEGRDAGAVARCVRGAHRGSRRRLHAAVAPGGAGREAGHARPQPRHPGRGGRRRRRRHRARPGGGDGGGHHRRLRLAVHRRRRLDLLT